MVSNRNNDVRSLSNFFLNIRAKTKAAHITYTYSKLSIQPTGVLPIITSRKVPSYCCYKGNNKTPKDQVLLIAVNAPEAKAIVPIISNK
jgi:hypothetical protein